MHSASLQIFLKAGPKALLSLALVLLVSITTTGCDQTGDAVAEERIAAPLVQVLEVIVQPSEETLTLIGEIVAPGAVDLAFEKSGKLASVNAPEGLYVAAGHELARLEARQFELDVQQAAAEKRLAELDVKRLSAVHERGMSSDAALDDARLQRDLAQVKLERAQYDLARTTMTAPFDAHISQRWVENHTHVQAGQSIVSLIPVGDREVKIYLPESIVSSFGMKPLRHATVRLRNRPDTKLVATLREHAVAASKTTGSYEARYFVSGVAGETLLPGMTALVDIVLSSQNTAGFRVPVSALHADPKGGFYVWCLTDNSVERSDVVVTDLRNDWAVIERGLSSGDQIVTASSRALSEGQLVSVSPVKAL